MGSGDVVRLDQLVPGGDLLDLQLLGSNCGRVFLGSGDVGGVSLGGSSRPATAWRRWWRSVPGQEGCKLAGQCGHHTRLVAL